MSDTNLFKQIAATNLPANLYLQMEPHLDSLLHEYEVSESEQKQLAFYKHEDNQERYAEIKEQFDELMRPAWVAFAHERWPDIDAFFTLEPSKENRPYDDVNFQGF